MSRIGKQPVALAGATVTIDGDLIKAKGPKGELSFKLHEQISVALQDGAIVVTPKNDSKLARSLWGMSRSMIANMVLGVTRGFERTLELVGVGYRAAMSGKDLELSLGYSHPIIYKAPAGVAFAVPKPTEIKITGKDKQELGQICSEIRKYRPPEPYKGKGVRYEGETVRRKEGKKK
ncbi:50S ribosomal protein L6 [Candidatus Phycosocius spiralis]|uniref:Large ribosomal subunit protein uL6 n=1 Tax=Candidatus Phycosocius spiralis TaxID=2815099 RepID=A0ABQ4PY56_9PROT|nr:50S ribosomal protein L6 [Candidatus Phycosocius spiralis]GIU67952.1 50S ribosomal protein L6 [Candidatus Phycosocius spiralis]